MKVPKPTFILHSLVNTKNLPQLSVEDTENTLKNAEEYQTPVSSSVKPTAIVSTQLHDLVQGNKPSAQALPFKVPFFRDDFPDNVRCIQNNVQVIPTVLPKLVNLSFSQPNSPRTPDRPRFRIATPIHPFGRSRCSENGDQSVLNTPCVMGALQELQMAHDTGLPDVLALVEDDLTGLNQLERQLLRNTDVELTDNNVVDYLLNVAHDYFVSAPDIAEDGHCHQQNKQIADIHLHKPQQTSSELKVRRKRRRRSEKRITPEEALVIRRQRCSRATRAQARQADKDPPRRHSHEENMRDANQSSLPLARSPTLASVTQVAMEIVQPSHPMVNTALRLMDRKRTRSSSRPKTPEPREGAGQEVAHQAVGHGQQETTACFPLVSLQSSPLAAQGEKGEKSFQASSKAQRQVDTRVTSSPSQMRIRRSKRNRRQSSRFEIKW